MQVIAKYEYNQNDYAIALKGDCITFLKKCDNSYQECIDDEEKSLALEVLSSFIPNESNAEYVDDICVNNHVYNLFYDAPKKLYFWHSKDGNNYEDDNIYLNKRYNHTLLTLYSNGKNKRKKQNNYIFRIFYKNRRSIALILAASLSFSALAGKDVLGVTSEQNTYANIFATESVEESIAEKTELFQDVLNSNPNLSKKEKDVISKLSFIFARYKGYINEPVVLERFRTLKVVYMGSTENGEAGYYKRIENVIFLHYPNFENTLLAIFIHEVLHVFQFGHGIHFLEELSNEHFTREILLELLRENCLEKCQLLNPENRDDTQKRAMASINPDVELYHSAKDSFQGYDYYMDIYYILAELIDADDLARFEFEGDISIIEKALLKKIGNTEENKKLVSSFSNASYFLRPIERDGFIFYFNKEHCYEVLNELYFKIKGYYLNEELEACAYISRYVSPNILGDYTEFMNENSSAKKVVIPKTIFSNAMPYPIIFYEYNSRLDKRVINDSMQEEYNSFLNSKSGRIRSESLQKN